MVVRKHRLHRTDTKLYCARKFHAQGHTAVIIGTEMIVFGGIVNGERVNEVRKSTGLTSDTRLCVDQAHTFDYRSTGALAL